MVCIEQIDGAGVISIENLDIGWVETARALHKKKILTEGLAGVPAVVRASSPQQPQGRTGAGGGVTGRLHRAPVCYLLAKK